MDFGFTPEQDAFREKIVAFAKNELNEGDLRQRDAECELSRDLWRKIAGFGLLGLPFPKQYGGSEEDIITTVLAMEALGYGCRDNGLLFSMNGQMWTVQMPISTFGTDEQKNKYLPGLIAGDLIGAHGITEPESGSDIMSLDTTARRDGDHYVLNGSKAFISGGGMSDVYVVMVRTGGDGPKGITCLVVEKDTPGLSFGAQEVKLGWKSQPTAQVNFSDCRVPVANRIGEEGQGFSIAMAGLDGGRLNIGACSLGAARACLERSIEYLKERRQFGRALAEFQALQFRLADMATELEAARLLQLIDGLARQVGVEGRE